MNYKKIEINYISIDEVEKQYIDKSLLYDSLGIKLNRNFAICQILYPRSIKKSNSKFVLVESENYDQRRCNILNYLIENIVIKNRQLGLKPATTMRRIKEVKYFIEYADNANLNFINDINQAIKAFLRYTKYLQSSIQQSKYAQRTASRLQKEAIKLLSHLFCVEPIEIKQSTTLIHSGNETRTTVAMNESDIQFCFNFYHDLFESIYGFIINNANYPYKVKIANTNYWFLPYTKGLIANESKAMKNSAFNCQTGKVLAYEDLYHEPYLNIDKQKRDGYKRAIRLFNQYLKNANSNSFTDERLAIAQIGVQAYYILFLFTTGMNDSTASTLKWNEDYTVQKEMQDFKNIKYRAGNKIVEFQIASKFLKLFKNFLDLRKYLLLNNFKSDYLFFQGYGENSYISTTAKSGNLSSSINNRISKIFNTEKLKFLTSRTIRLYKTKYLIKHHGVIQAANTAQVSVVTLLKHYTGENEETSAEQMTKYYDDLNKSVLMHSPNDKAITAGHCSSFTNPDSDMKLKSINIDCEKSEGCLFCKHFRCHADSDDVRKLLSLLYIIEETKNKADSIEHFNSIYLVVIDRINYLLEEISKHQKDLVEKIREEVFEHEILSYYWEKRLEMLIEIGVL
ncbi:hypothetical protein LPB137_05150 [Poseidonibacter parvus]|uniref:Uncharacterized protein n=1 Tax=Poseidonibacter parvus TaxID=1850254 RepID=A0A1P8KL82_9BACT|nr:hypothetical protein [Poseidonibacter parvus]APW65276.1 hypothetical protein LPB137_05150 [Poseidonibacter parvus]